MQKRKGSAMTREEAMIENDKQKIEKIKIKKKKK